MGAWVDERAEFRWARPGSVGLLYDRGEFKTDISEMRFQVGLWVGSDSAQKIAGPIGREILLPALPTPILIDLPISLELRGWQVL